MDRRLTRVVAAHRHLVHRIPRTPRRTSTRPSERLETYRAKRDFSVTSEPSGTEPPSPHGRRFVVQRHRATRLHYDLRLEMAGVLASWAVPKGPTLDAGVKRMAVHVEDHPLDYFDFEGVIPSGEYGGGDVIVWDWGTWALAPHERGGDDPVAAVEAGNLHFDLDGEKLRGRFVLVQRGDQRGKPQWLLLKKRDDAAEPGWDPEEHPRSVRSGRTNDEVAAAPAATWSSEVSWAAPTADAVAALEALGAKGRWRVGETAVSLSRLDDVVIPAAATHDAIARRDLVRHLTSVAPAMLPHLRDRPVRLHRFPQGVGHAGSWQRTVPSAAPSWLIRHQDELIVDSPAALAWVAGRSTLELLASTATTAAPDRPTWAIVRIDPGADGSLDDALVTARLLRIALEHLHLEGRPVLAGPAIEVRIPIVARYTHDEVRAWVAQLSDAIATTLASAPSPQALDGTWFVAPFSVLPTIDASVVVPLGWDELDDPQLRPDRWTIGTIGERLSSVGDPLAPLIGTAQRLPTL